MNNTINDIIEKSLQELAAKPTPQQRSRTWTSPTGYRYLVQWSNAVLLRYLIRLFTNSLPKSEYRRKAQVDDAARSVVRNIEEGFKRSNTSTYVEFIGFSQGSLEEVKGDVRELTEDGFLPSRPGSSLVAIGINLGDFNKALLKGNYRNLEEHKGSNNSINSFNSPLKSSSAPLTFSTKKPPDSDRIFLYTPLSTLYPPLAKVRAQDLTYEIFMELVNKTDWLLRKLVESLEKKLSHDQKYYKVEQARIRDKFSKK